MILLYAALACSGPTVDETEWGPDDDKQPAADQTDAVYDIDRLLEIDIGARYLVVNRASDPLDPAAHVSTADIWMRS